MKSPMTLSTILFIVKTELPLVLSFPAAAAALIAR